MTTRASGAHAREERVREVHGAEEVRVHRAAGHALVEAVQGDARVVHEDVDGAHPFRERGATLRVGDVEDRELGAGTLDGRQRRAVPVARRADDAKPRAREAARDSETDAAVRAGDDGDAGHGRAFWHVKVLPGQPPSAPQATHASVQADRHVFSVLRHALRH